MSKEEDIGRSYGAAGEDWRERALYRIFEIAIEHKTFTPDDVWLSGLEQPPNDPRALGGVMRDAVRMGICKMQYCEHCNQPIRQASIREETNDRAINVWKSLVYEGANG